jgi:hypothetical protein
MTKFFLIHSQARHGTHLVRTTLDEHPDIIGYGEIINHLTGNPKTPLAEYNPGFMKYRKRPAGLFFSHYKKYDHPAEIVGFCLHSRQLFVGGGGKTRRNRIRNALLGMPFKVIEIGRKNLLAAYASLEFARRTGGWSFNMAGKRHTTGKIEFKRRDWMIYKSLTRSERKKARKSLSKFPTLFLWYEDIVARPDVCIPAMQEFLEAEVREIGPRTRKQDVRPLEKRFSNWTDVVKTLKDTKWEGCLHDDPPEWLD